MSTSRTAGSLCALSHFTSWAAAPLPLSKADLVAAPGGGGAMENLGMLVFDEDRLLFGGDGGGDGGGGSGGGAWDAWRAADVVCHEVSHQWFGDLVTTATWVSCAVF